MRIPSKNKSLSAGYEKTGAYLDENRKLDARFCVKGFQELVEANAAAPTVQLQSIRIALAVIAYRGWNFRVMDVSRAFLRSKPLGGNTYVKLPDGAGQDNLACGDNKALYGLSTVCKGWYRTIRNFLTDECGGEVTSLDKSVFFWAKEGFSYGYGRRYRNPNQANLDKNEFKANGNFPKEEKRTAMWPIAIHVDDLLISGSGSFLEYITFRMKEIRSRYFWGK